MTHDHFFKPVPPDKAAEAYQRIKAALSRHRHPPGAYLNIRALADKLHVSPTPVREALIRLADDGVISFTRGRGYVVKALDLEEIVADYDAAIMMAKYAIERNTGGTLQHGVVARPAFATAVRALDEEEAAQAAPYLENLYDRVANLSGNIRIIRQMRQFCDRTTHIRQFGMMSAAPFYPVVSQMSQFEDALVGGNRGEAVAIFEEQIRRKIGGLQDLVKDLNLQAQQSRVPLEDLL